MARRRNRRYPTAPVRAFGEGRIPKPIRRRLRRRANRAAARIYNPEIRALQRSRRGVERRYQRNISSARGAVEFAQEAISNVPLKGLRGEDRKMLAEELALSSRDVAASLPFLESEARQQRFQESSAIRSDILSARIEKKQTAARTFNALMNEARQDIEDHLRAKAKKADEREDARKKARRENLKELRTAVRVATNLLATTPERKRPWGKAAIRHFGSEEAAWRDFENFLATKEAVTPDAARKAVAEIRRRLKLKGRRRTEVSQTTGPARDARIRARNTPFDYDLIGR